MKGMTEVNAKRRRLGNVKKEAKLWLLGRFGQLLIDLTDKTK